MKVDIKNKRIVDCANQELSQIRVYEQLRGILGSLIIAMAFGIMPILIESRFTLINTITVVWIIIQFFIYTKIRSNFFIYVKEYFLYVGINSAVISVVALYSAYRYLILYENKPYIYLGVLSITFVLGAVLGYKVFDCKLKSDKDLKKKSPYGYGVCLAAGGIGMSIARYFAPGMSQNMAYWVLAMVLSFMAIGFLSNIKFLSIYHHMRKRDISFSELEIRLSDKGNVISDKSK